MSTKTKPKSITFSSGPVVVPGSLWDWWLTPVAGNESYADMRRMRAIDLNEELYQTYSEKSIYNWHHGHWATPINVRKVLQREFLMWLFDDKNGQILAELLLD